MDSVVVTTIAGSGRASWVDGIGTAASFDGAIGICYSQSRDALLIAELDSNRVRCLYPATEQRRKALTHSLSHWLKVVHYRLRLSFRYFMIMRPQTVRFPSIG